MRVLEELSLLDLICCHTTPPQVSILGADYQAQLREQIPEANLPKQYGGVCICEGVPGGCRNGDVGVWNNGKGVPHS